MGLRPEAAASGRTVTSGYKVDIGRGERIGRVSSKWFSHPDDERFLSLGALHAAMRYRSERATTRTVETRALRIEAIRAAREAIVARKDADSETFLRKRGFSKPET